MAEGDDRRIRQLIESATQAFAGGRAQDAERLLRQAEAEAPRHPLVLNEIARRMLLAGNPARRVRRARAGDQGDPTDASMWLNLAAALRGLKRGDEEMAALQRCSPWNHVMCARSCRRRRCRKFRASRAMRRRPTAKRCS
mgnify:CR=1 FL=1